MSVVQKIVAMIINLLKLLKFSYEERTSELDLYILCKSIQNYTIRPTVLYSTREKFVQKIVLTDFQKIVLRTVKLDRLYLFFYCIKQELILTVLPPI